MAARIPPSDAAPDIAVRDQPKADVMGETNTDKVATAPPWRDSPAQQAHARMTHP